MATKPYNISDLRMLAPRFRSTSKTEILSVRVFASICLVNINLDKTPKPIFNKHWSMDDLAFIISEMTAFSKAEPNTEVTFVKNVYNNVERKKVMDYVLIFKRDERKIFHIIIKTNGQVYDFPIMNNTMFSTGTGDIPEDVKSQIGWNAFTDFIKNKVWLQMQLSAFPNENQQNGQQGGGGYNRQGGGYNNNRNYAPRPNNGEFQSSRGLPGDEDIFE